HMDLGSFLRTNKRPLEAETIYKQALALYEKAYAQDLANPHSSTSLATCYANLCHTYRDLNQPEQAIAWALKTITILKADLERDPRQYDVRWLLRNAHWGRAAALDDL